MLMEWEYGLFIPELTSRIIFPVGDVYSACCIVLPTVGILGLGTVMKLNKYLMCTFKNFFTESTTCCTSSGMRFIFECFSDIHFVSGHQPGKEKSSED